jgi:hypothetical protein
MKELTEVQKAYIAGIMDGEGFICIGRSISKNRSRWEYTPMVSATNTNRELLTWLQATTRIGNVSPKPDSARKKNWKVAHQWRLRAYEMPKFLQAIEPYLVIKQVQCELMLEFLANTPHIGGRTTDAQDLLSRVIWSEMADLNKRGT